MPDPVGFSPPPQIPRYPGPPRRRTSGRRAKLALLIALVFLAGGAGLLLGYKKFLGSSHGAALAPLPPIPEFAAFRKLDDFVGVDCFYTNKFAEPLAVGGEGNPPVVQQGNTVNLAPMSQVRVKQVDQQTADYDHPASKGYRLYLVTSDPRAMPPPSASPIPNLPVLPITLVLYPTIGNNGEIIELQLCPISSYQKARDLWLGKRFNFSSDKIAEIDPGTAVSVADIQPAGLGTGGLRFDVTFKLPSGLTVTESMTTDEIRRVLQPMGP